ncbi:MAG: peptidylprolyl isomerase [Oligoflexia bacterium]|nr:peptidylprolyl isomerase [Oligoflexia bacterium]
MKVYIIDYVLKNSKGDVLDKSHQGHPLAFISEQGQIIPGLEKEIVTLKVGEEKKIEVKSDEAYGPYVHELIQDVPLTALPDAEKLKVGDRMWGETNQGKRPFLVKAINKTHATMDGNHPLAGQDLFFEVKLVQVRDATEEELLHGHVHGPGGHHH